MRAAGQPIGNADGTMNEFLFSFCTQHNTSSDTATRNKIQDVGHTHSRDFPGDRVCLGT